MRPRWSAADSAPREHAPTRTERAAPSNPRERARLRGVFGGGAWRLLRVAGIDIGIDHSWPVIFFLVTYSLNLRFGGEHGAWPVALSWTAAVAASLVFFTSIVLHELGHSLTAIRLGVRVRSITLFIFGGVAQLDSDPKRPRDEVAIAVAGPIVSLALGAGFLGIAYGLPHTSRSGEALAAVCGWLGQINLMLAAFNAVPGLPLDGGRVLRGIVWAITGSLDRATRVAANSGAVFAYALMGVGALAVLAGSLVGGFWLILIAWFLRTASRAAVGQLVLERVLERVSSRQLMEPVERFCVSGSESVADAAEHRVMPLGARTLYVVDAAGQLRGLATLRELARPTRERRAVERVENVMVPLEQLVTVAPEDTGWVALRRMLDRNVNQLPVIERDRLLGVVTRQRLLSLVQSALVLGEDASR